MGCNEGCGLGIKDGHGMGRGIGIRMGYRDRRWRLWVVMGYRDKALGKGVGIGIEW